MFNQKKILAFLLIVCTSCVIDDNDSQRTQDFDLLYACENGNANGFPCLDIDLLGYVSLDQMMGTQGNDCWGWTDPDTEREYALMGMVEGTAFVDVTEPKKARFLGLLPSQTDPSIWRDIKVYENTAYIVSEALDHGIQVFDLTRLRTINAEPQTFTANTVYDDHGSAHNIAIDTENGYAYSVGTSTYDGGPHIINITDPLNPIGVGGYEGSEYSHDGQTVRYIGPDTDYYDSEIFVGSNENEVVIVNVTQKQNPTLISKIEYSQTQYTHQGWFTEDQQFFLVGDELDELREDINTRTIVFDFTDLDAPKLHFEYVSDQDAIDHNGYVRDDLFYLASYRAGLRIIDISQIEDKKMTEIAYFDTHPEDNSAQGFGRLPQVVIMDEDHDNPAKGNDAEFNGAWSVYPFLKSGNILISDINRGLFIVRQR